MVVASPRTPKPQVTVAADTSKAHDEQVHAWSELRLTASVTRLRCQTASRATGERHGRKGRIAW